MPKLEDFQRIVWDDSMATGIATIDKQHQYLIDTLDEANRHLLAETDTTYLRTIVNELLSYALIHFESEEALMQRYDYATAYPEQAQIHIAQHREFSSRVVAIQEQLREGRKVSRTEVLRFLNTWLADHVLGTDKLFYNYLIQKTNY
jgi:hemerythrin-like metal-binding protein